MIVIWRLPLVIWVSCLLCACITGAKPLKDGRSAYNEAVRSSSDEELLLNIVHLRYLDTLQFMSISSIAAQVEFSVSIGATAGQDQGDDTALGLAGATWSSSPTFTFTPQRGREFARSIIEPVSLQALVDLAGAGHDLRILFALLVQRLNGLPNELSSSARSFDKIVRLMAQMQRDQMLYFGYVERRVNVSGPIDADKVSGTDLIEAANANFRFDPAASEGRLVLTKADKQPLVFVSPQAPNREQLLSGLRLDAQRTSFDLRSGTSLGNTMAPDSISVDTRSVLAALSYLARGVDVPDAHLERGWSPTLTELRIAPPGPAPYFRVRSSRRRPDAQLAVNYRDTWYYLADDDAFSRRIFFVLAEFMRLVVAPEQGQSPILTIPIGG